MKNSNIENKDNKISQRRGNGPYQYFMMSRNDSVLRVAQTQYESHVDSFSVMGRNL